MEPCDIVSHLPCVQTSPRHGCRPPNCKAKSPGLQVGKLVLPRRLLGEMEAGALADGTQPGTLELVGFFFNPLTREFYKTVVED